ncbi:uracil-DNA glycosylase isoform X2 [Conger conger]|uniref:uracil-DNA glycosylase isoform X2 n=1 Tax=Conger conger TaxID=82655 RepID=UPI002A5A4746|nr:uracil-DNA glycosylase isoform X2 [Conger conger]
MHKMCTGRNFGQKTIKTYFSPVAQKKLQENNETGEVTNLYDGDISTTAKRRKPASGEPPGSPLLSSEQLDRIERNRKDALQRLAARNVPPGFGESWHKALGEEFAKPYFTRVMSFVTEERERYTVYPAPQQVFSWTQMCPIHKVKVVILGQDPYHGPCQAHGLSFSVQRPTLPPPSLENVFKELMEDVEGFQHPGYGDLSGWAQQGSDSPVLLCPLQQPFSWTSFISTRIPANTMCVHYAGVLLLNAVLTVRAHQPNSHQERGWETFTDAVVSWLSANLDGLVFLLWGGQAQRKGAVIDRKRHHVLQTSHPSPMSVHRGFFGCKHFSKTNCLLEKSGKTPIDWTIL